MPGSRKGKKQEEETPPPQPKEKKRATQAEIRADDKAAGQQGKASAAAAQASYGFGSVTGRHMKSEIADEFHKRNNLERDNKRAQENEWIYLKYHHDHVLRRNACNKLYNVGKAVASGRAQSMSKDELEMKRRGPDKKVLMCSAQGESTDYDMEGDDNMKKVLAKLPPLPASPPAMSTTSQPPATSRAGPQESPTPPPTQAEQVLLSRKAIHKMPPPSEAGQAKSSKEPLSPSFKWSSMTPRSARLRKRKSPKGNEGKRRLDARSLRCLNWFRLHPRLEHQVRMSCKQYRRYWIRLQV